MVSIIHPEMRSNACFIVGVLLAAICGGVFPDAISHGIILAGRDGHEALAVIGLFLIASGMLWYGFSYSLSRRFGAARRRFMEVVD